MKEKRIVVTGGTRGIGRDIVERFLKGGHRVIATYRSNEQEANLLKDSLILYGDHFQLAKFDVSKWKDVCEFFNSLEKNWGGLDILVNNSGIRKDNIVPNMSEEDWDQVLDTNLKGAFLMSKLAVPLMMRERFGRIIMMSSVGGKLSLPGQGNYAASKAGLLAFAKGLSKEVAKKNITVNSICPGFIETELINDLSPEQRKEYLQDVPMKRFGKVSEVSAAVEFLASDEASYITGSEITISGGL